MSRLDDLEDRVKALEDEVGVRSGVAGFRARLALPSYKPGQDLPEGPYGYVSQDR